MAKAANKVTLDAATQQRVEHIAFTSHRTPETILREAVEQYVEREEKRESLRYDLHKAWTHFQTTGLHLSEYEADVWLAQLEAGEDADAPKCHV